MPTANTRSSPGHLPWRFVTLSCQPLVSWSSYLIVATPRSVLAPHKPQPVDHFSNEWHGGKSTSIETVYNRGPMKHLQQTTTKWLPPAELSCQSVLSCSWFYDMAFCFFRCVTLEPPCLVWYVKTHSNIFFTFMGVGWKLGSCNSGSYR